MGLNRGAMTLIDEDRAHELYDAMGPAIEISGGSAANTMVGLASFGRPAAYLGKVRDDQLGEVFAHDIRSTGVTFRSPPRRPTVRARALPHRRHARRPAHDEHLPRRVGVPRPRRRRRRPRRGGAGRVPRGLPLGPARRRRRRTARPPRIAHDGGERGLADALRLVLRRPAPARVADARRRRGRRPLRQRGRDLRAVRVRLRRRPWKRSGATAASPRSHAPRTAR